MTAAAVSEATATVNELHSHLEVSHSAGQVLGAVVVQHGLLS